jgi:protein-L-isoaspartate(D-aspartate) O-methyltransferase
MGWPKAAPYDIVLLDGAVEQVPAALVKQLTGNGRFAGAIADRGITRLVIGSVAGDALGLRSLADADVAILPGFERPRAFTF